MLGHLILGISPVVSQTQFSSTKTIFFIISPYTDIKIYFTYYLKDFQQEKFDKYQNNWVYIEQYNQDSNDQNQEILNEFDLTKIDKISDMLDSLCKYFWSKFEILITEKYQNCEPIQLSSNHRLESIIGLESLTDFNQFSDAKIQEYGL